jgi:hypothetical protein
MISELAYQNPKETSSERTSLRERVLVTSRINKKVTCEFFDNTFAYKPECQEDISDIAG